MTSLAEIKIGTIYRCSSPIHRCSKDCRANCALILTIIVICDRITCTYLPRASTSSMFCRPLSTKTLCSASAPYHCQLPLRYIDTVWNESQTNMSSAWEISVIVSLKYSKVNWSRYQYVNRCIDEMKRKTVLQLYWQLLQFSLPFPLVHFLYG